MSWAEFEEVNSVIDQQYIPLETTALYNWFHLIILRFFTEILQNVGQKYLAIKNLIVY